MKQPPIQCSIGVLTYNSAGFLERCLKSLEGFSEIIISDGGSTDATLEIARRYGCTIMQQSQQGKPIGDFALERNRMLGMSKEDWFFYLDSDEVLSKELKDEMRAICNASEIVHYVYLVPWKITNKEMTIVYRSFKNYYQPRFFHKGSGARFIRKVHERISFDLHKFKPGKVQNPWYVSLDIQLDFATYREKVDHRIAIMAKERAAKNIFQYLKQVLYEPIKNTGKQLIKFAYLRMRYPARELPPAVYELYKLYSQWVFIKQYTKQYAKRWRAYMKVISYAIAYALRTVMWLFAREPEVAVLMYHMVDNSSASLAVSPSEFEGQMAYLSRTRSVVPLGDVVEFVRGNRIFAHNTVAVTFDDGYADIKTTVLPILRQYSIPATIFVPSVFSATTDKAFTPRLTEEETRTLSADPLLSFESHGKTHVALSNLSLEKLTEEIEGSRKDLARILDKEPRFFAYPYGARSSEAEEAVHRAGYAAGFAITEGLVRPGDNTARVKRIQIDNTVNKALFIMRLTRAVDFHRNIVAVGRRILKRI